MPQYNIYQAKAHLSSLVERASDGEEIIIAKSGRPCARLVSLEESPLGRRPGRARGRIRIGRNFDAPLPAGLAAAFGVSPSQKRRW